MLLSASFDGVVAAEEAAAAAASFIVADDDKDDDNEVEPAAVFRCGSCCKQGSSLRLRGPGVEPFEKAVVAEAAEATAFGGGAAMVTGSSSITSVLMETSASVIGDVVVVAVVSEVVAAVADVFSPSPLSKGGS